MARGTPQDTRRQDSLKVLMRLIGRFVKGSIDDYLAEGKDQRVIDAARSYMADHPNEKISTPHAFMVQIRGNVEKQCKLNNIPAPSATSISTYLKEAKLV